MDKQVKKELSKRRDSTKAKLLQRYFKTNKGQYGEGDVFLGITVPKQREVAKKFYKEISLAGLQKLLRNKIHEYRLTALLMLVDKYKKASEKEQKQIVEFYLKNTNWINNWDLVDLSAVRILGSYLMDKPKNILYKLAHSQSLWERRIAVLSTFEFIRNQQYEDTLKIATILLHDKHDLIQKAVGWLLREVGKKHLQTELSFLNKHYKTMPRTTLRYAIERLTPKQRLFYLNKKF